MKFIKLNITLMVFTCLTTMPAQAQFKMARSAFGNGGGVCEGDGLRLTGTVSQNFIGAPVNGQFANLVGFWYQTSVELPTHVEDGDTDVLPASYELEQNYPNPFNPSTNIRFALPEAGRASLKVYNLLGQQVATLLDRELTAGTHSVVFEASHLPSGVYLYRLQAGGFSQVKRLTLMK